MHTGRSAPAGKQCVSSELLTRVGESVFSLIAVDSVQEETDPSLGMRHHQADVLSEENHADSRRIWVDHKEARVFHRVTMWNIRQNLFSAFVYTRGVAGGRRVCCIRSSVCC